MKKAKAKKVIAVVLVLVILASVLILQAFAVPNVLCADFEAIDIAENQSASEILSALGIEDVFIENLSPDITEKIPLAIKAYKINENENDLSLSKNVWVLELSGGEAEYGEYIILGTFEYTKMPVWRGTDVFTVYIEGLVFNQSDFSVTAIYNEKVKTDGKTETVQKAEKSDSKFGGFYSVVGSYNLPNGVGSKCSDLKFLVVADAAVGHPDSPCNIMVNMHYSHQNFGAGFNGNCVDANVDTNPVSPKIFYKTHTVRSQNFIEYKPQALN